MKKVLMAICSAFVLPVAAALHAVEGISPTVYYGAEHAVMAGDKTAELAVIVIHGWRGCGTADVTRGSLDVSPPAMQQGKNRYDRFINFKEYLKGYPAWAARVSFHDIPGIGHSGAVYRDASFLDFLACGF